MRGKLKIILTLAITLCVLSIPFFDSYATFYDEVVPSYVNLQGVYFIEYTGFTPPYGGLNNVQVTVLIPHDHINDFAFDGAGNLVNLTTSTITSRAFARTGNTSSEVYVVRWQSYGICQVRSASSPYTYTDLSHTRGCQNTNLHFLGTHNFNRPFLGIWNDNFYLTDGENLIFVLLLFLIFFEVIGGVFVVRRRHL